MHTTEGQLPNPITDQAFVGAQNGVKGVRTGNQSPESRTVGACDALTNQVVRASHRCARLYSSHIGLKRAGGESRSAHPQSESELSAMHVQSSEREVCQEQSASKTKRSIAHERRMAWFWSQGRKQKSKGACLTVKQHSSALRKQQVSTHKTSKTHARGGWVSS